MFPFSERFDWGLQHAVQSNQTFLRQWDETPCTLLELFSAVSSCKLSAQCMEVAHTTNSGHTFRVYCCVSHRPMHVLDNRYWIWTYASHSCLPVCKSHLKLKLLWNKSWGIWVCMGFFTLGVCKTPVGIHQLVATIQQCCIGNSQQSNSSGSGWLFHFVWWSKGILVTLLRLHIHSSFS